VFIVNLNITISYHTMAPKRHLEEDEIERELMFNSDLDCCTEDEFHDWEYEDEDDKELVQPSSLSSSSLGAPQQHGRRSANNFSSGAAGVNLREAPHVNDSTLLCV
jgi:hypothetical protein